MSDLAIAEKSVDAARRAQALMYEGRFSDALAVVSPHLGGDRPDGELLYIAAVCERYLSRPARARASLDRLIAQAPAFSRAYQELGHLHRASGAWEAAYRAYRQACLHNPSLIAAWRGLKEAATILDQAEASTLASANLARLEALPKQVLAASNLLYEGKLAKAEKLVRAFLQKNPKNVEAIRVLAEIGSRMGILEDAEFLLESALQFAPGHLEARIDYVKILRKRQKYGRALEEAEKLHAAVPDNPVVQSQYAIECVQVGDYARGIALFDAVLEKLPGDPATLTSKGHALKTYGEQSAAIVAYRAAFETKPDHGDAWYALANLKTYRFEEGDIDRMRALEADGATALNDRINICFALGKALEDRGAYEDSFSYYREGNRLKRQQSRYDADDMQAEFDAQKAICTAELFAEKRGLGYKAPDPIFIVGLPRAGSTLIEQILASHSQVDGTLELPNILALARRLRGRHPKKDNPRYPAVLQHLDGDKLSALGRQYIDETRIHRQGAPFFTDKMPNNFRHIGLIHLILPNAKIIDARREPMACCFSGFKQLFAEGQDFTYGLEEIGRYYAGYVDLMAHWDAVLPGRILRVQHEDVVADLEGEVGRLLDFLDLDFEPACIDFHKTERAVRTASSEQVRRPISDKGLEQWRHFAPYLEPLRQALGETLGDTRGRRPGSPLRPEPGAENADAYYSGSALPE